MQQTTNGHRKTKRKYENKMILSICEEIVGYGEPIEMRSPHAHSETLRTSETVMTNESEGRMSSQLTQETIQCWKGSSAARLLQPPRDSITRLGQTIPPQPGMKSMHSHFRAVLPNNQGMAWCKGCALVG